jgi:hypothetical protein
MQSKKDWEDTLHCITEGEGSMNEGENRSLTKSLDLTTQDETSKRETSSFLKTEIRENDPRFLS